MLPALPLDEAGKYVAAAYLVFLLLIFVYVAIMASKLSRIEREVVEIADLVEARDKAAAAPPARAKEPVPR
jgi:CcmD family protein